MGKLFSYLFLGIFIATGFNDALADKINYYSLIIMILAVLGWLILSLFKDDFGVDQNPEDLATHNDNIRRKFYDIM